MDLRKWFFGGAAALLLADCLAILMLAGAFRGRTAPIAALAGLILAAAAVNPSGPARAEISSQDQFAMAASLDTRLAFVTTGDATIDAASSAGLRGLSNFLTRRTAIEPGEPMGVDLETDELAFFPLLYWPLDADSERPSDEAMARIDAYMKNGGTILFDTRDQISGSALSTLEAITPATVRLRAILDGLDIPPLEPVPPDHVLTKAFYLLQDFPGRWSGSPLWVEVLSRSEAREDRPARAGDGVSPIMITANDMAGAWAVHADGSFMFPTVPADGYQREMAIRAGINIAVYTMTGNYKADQVHIPALLERLGQ